MIDFLPYKPYHLQALDLQPAQSGYLSALKDPEYGAGLAVPNLAWSALIGGKLVGCAGILPQWEGRAMCWALLSVVPKQAWVRLTREVVAVLERAHMDGHRRIETTVLVGFKQAERWAKLMGFQREGCMRAYAPDGADHYLYARVRP